MRRVHRPQPRRAARRSRTTITGERDPARCARYFLGVTIVAAFNAVVVGIGALVLDVPLAGTIAVVTFVTAYIPFIGAFVSGAFAVAARARRRRATTTALIMLVIVILANGLLQNIVQPIAFGATLELNPLVVLDRHHRLRRHLRDGRARPRGAAHVGRRAHQPRARHGQGEGDRP